MAVEHDCLGVEQDLADLKDELREEREARDAGLKLLEMTQTCFGDIVRGKDHDGGNLMRLIDIVLQDREVRARLKAFEAGERLAGRHKDVAPLSYLDERAVVVLVEVRDALAALFPHEHRLMPEHWQRAQAALKGVVKILEDTGNWSR